MSEETTPTYISKVRLKGFKSIIDTECTFKPGLNIIVGDNGSGKSNFLDFLEAALNENTKDPFDGLLFWSIEYNKSHIHTYKKTINYPSNGIIISGQNLYKITKEEFISNVQIIPESKEGIIDMNYPYTKINFEIAPDCKEFSSSFTLKYKFLNSLDSDYNYGFPEINAKNLIIKEIFYNGKISPFIVFQFNNITSIKSIRKNILHKYGEITKKISKYLNRHSNITEIRIAENFNLEINSQLLKMSFIHFEFLISGKWFNWDDLSDGTQRMFYLISTITLETRDTILIEEPELGIHPDQLFKLMDFIQEQAKTKQIIISTHSPEVLNHLKRTPELDRVIICKHEGEVGTKMYHLEEEEKEHIKEYILEEGFLSDYWIHQGFDKEETKRAILNNKRRF